MKFQRIITTLFLIGEETHLTIVKSRDVTSEEADIVEERRAPEPKEEEYDVGW